jgi:hypothetical protein
LNATNGRVLTEAYGPDTDLWIDHVIELYAGEFHYQGKMQPGVLVKPISTRNLEPPKPAPNRPSNGPHKPSDMDDDIPFGPEFR